MTAHPRRLARLQRTLDRKIDEQALESQPDRPKAKKPEPEEQRQKRLAAEIAVLEGRIDRGGRVA